MAMAYPLGVQRAQIITYMIYWKDQQNYCCGWWWCSDYTKNDKLRRETDAGAELVFGIQLRDRAATVD